MEQLSPCSTSEPVLQSQCCATREATVVRSPGSTGEKAARQQRRSAAGSNGQIKLHFRKNGLVLKNILGPMTEHLPCTPPKTRQRRHGLEQTPRTRQPQRALWALRKSPWPSWRRLWVGSCPPSSGVSVLTSKGGAEAELRSQL